MATNQQVPTQWMILITSPNGGIRAYGDQEDKAFDFRRRATLYASKSIAIERIKSLSTDGIATPYPVDGPPGRLDLLLVEDRQSAVA